MVRIEKSLIEIQNRNSNQEERITKYERKMNDVIATLKTMSQWVNANKSERTKLKRSIHKMVDELQQQEPNEHRDTNGISPQTTPPFFHRRQPTISTMRKSTKTKIGQ